MYFQYPDVTQHDKTNPLDAINDVDEMQLSGYIGWEVIYHLTQDYCNAHYMTTHFKGISVEHPYVIQCL